MIAVVGRVNDVCVIQLTQILQLLIDLQSYTTHFYTNSIIDQLSFPSKNVNQ